jgi:hypothetical protein
MYQRNSWHPLPHDMLQTNEFMFPVVRNSSSSKKERMHMCNKFAQVGSLWRCSCQLKMTTFTAQCIANPNLVVRSDLREGGNSNQEIVVRFDRVVTIICNWAPPWIYDFYTVTSLISLNNWSRSSTSHTRVVVTTWNPNTTPHLSNHPC